MNAGSDTQTRESPVCSVERKCLKKVGNWSLHPPPPDSYRWKFLSLSTSDTLSGQFFAVRDCPVCCRMISSIPGLHPRGAIRRQPKQSSGIALGSLVEDHWSRSTAEFQVEETQEIIWAKALSLRRS